MVVFGSTDYFHALDAPKSHIKDMHVKEFGVSSKIGDVLQSVKADIATGAKHIEMVFMGTGKGSLSNMNTNPEMFDKTKREEIRQLAKINGVTLSTHAAIQMSGFSGFGEQGFNDRLRQDRLQEIKRTVDFAADTAGGGAVVVHTNEFPREIKDSRFQVGTKEQEALYLADRETGKTYAVKKEGILLPKWIKDKEGNYLDIDGKPITDAHDYTNRAIEKNEKGEAEFEKKTYDQFATDIQKWNEKHPSKRINNTEKEFVLLQEFQKIQAEQPRILEYQEQAQRLEKTYKKVKEDIDGWKELEQKTPQNRQDYLLQLLKIEYREQQQQITQLEEEGMKPSQILEKLSQKLKSDASHYREGVLGFKKHVADLELLYENIDSIEKVGVERSAKTFAEAAVYAYRLEKQKKLDKPIIVSPENMFAEWGYGGHPDELRELIIASRKEMSGMLMKDHGIKEKDARKIAEQHIKATFDTGHANTWAKYFTDDPKLSPEENKKKFDSWLVGEVKKLVQEGIIGNVHISDNFGYQDEHLNVGGGNAPLRDLIQVFRDPKYEGKLVVEWGAQGPEEQQEAGALLAAWANLAGSPIYRVEGVAPRWSDIETGGYFGTSSSPFHVSGAYGTGLGKDWRLWSYSEAPIE